MLTRRDFIGTVAAGAAALAGVRGAEAQGAGDAKPQALTSAGDKVVLGRTGLRPSMLGLGTGTHGVGKSSNQKRLGQAEFTRLVRHAIDHGVTYLDCADQYGTHEFVRNAIQGVNRDDLFILSKTHADTAEEAAADIERFRRELGVETIDVVLLHCMTRGTWTQDRRPAMDALAAAKAKGHVRAVGVSCHGWQPLIACRDEEWIDVQLARINPFGSAMDAKAAQVSAELAAMHAKGRGVLGMKIYGGGGNTGAADREQSLRYVLGLGTVDAFTIGFESVEQFDETYKLIGRVLGGAA